MRLVIVAEKDGEINRMNYFRVPDKEFVRAGDPVAVEDNEGDLKLAVAACDAFFVQGDGDDVLAAVNIDPLTVDWLPATAILTPITPEVPDAEE